MGLRERLLFRQTKRLPREPKPEPKSVFQHVKDASNGKLEDWQIWSLLHDSANAKSTALRRGDEQLMREARQILDETLAEIKSFADLSTETKEELIKQKTNWEVDLTPEEEAWREKSGLFPPRW